MLTLHNNELIALHMYCKIKHCKVLTNEFLIKLEDIVNNVTNSMKMHVLVQNLFYEEMQINLNAAQVEFIICMFKE